MDAAFDRDKKKDVIQLSYEDATKFPSDGSSNQIMVDVSNESLLLPISGRLVPFHISMVKNVNKYDQGEHTYLRINFVAPDSAAADRSLPVSNFDVRHRYLVVITIRMVLDVC